MPKGSPDRGKELERVKTMADFLRVRDGLIEDYLNQAVRNLGIPPRVAERLTREAFRAGIEGVNNLMTPQQKDALNRRIVE